MLKAGFHRKFRVCDVTVSEIKGSKRIKKIQKGSNRIRIQVFCEPGFSNVFYGFTGFYHVFPGDETPEKTVKSLPPSGWDAFDEHLRRYDDILSPSRRPPPNESLPDFPTTPVRKTRGALDIFG